jgi:methionine-rich copper-binding protein CopC
MRHRLITRVARVGLLLAVTMVAATLDAGAAAAHAARISSDPVDHAELAVGPTRVSATFNEQLQNTFAAMTVVGPDNNLWSSGEPKVQGAIVSVDLRPLGPAGAYTVNYRVTSADGHVVSGSWSFELTTPGTGTPGPPAYTRGTPTGGVPPWVFAAGAVLLVAGAALWAVRRRQ